MTPGADAVFVALGVAVDVAPEGLGEGLERRRGAALDEPAFLGVAGGESPDDVPEILGLRVHARHQRGHAGYAVEGGGHDTAGAHVAQGEEAVFLPLGADFLPRLGLVLVHEVLEVFEPVRLFPLEEGVRHFGEGHEIAVPRGQVEADFDRPVLVQVGEQLQPGRFLHPEALAHGPVAVGRPTTGRRSARTGTRPARPASTFSGSRSPSGQRIWSNLMSCAAPQQGQMAWYSKRAWASSV